MRNAVLQDQIRGYDLSIVEVEVITFNGHSDSGASLCSELEAVRERRQVADKVRDNVAVHEAWSCGVGAGNVGASEGGVGGYQGG